MTSAFPTATTWLSHISGQNPIPTPTKKELSKDPIIRDLHAMKDTEVKAGVFRNPPPKHNRMYEKHHTQMQPQQPKPKFVSHKDPVKGRKEKVIGKSNRLGGEHMA